MRPSWRKPQVAGIRTRTLTYKPAIPNHLRIQPICVTLEPKWTSNANSQVYSRQGTGFFNEKRPVFRRDILLSLSVNSRSALQ
jgi:hypothetical protein